MMHDPAPCRASIGSLRAHETRGPPTARTVNGRSPNRSSGAPGRCYRTGVQVFLPWFLVAQAAVFPTLAPGSEVRLVSPDLLQVHASGRVEEGRLRLEGRPLVPGAELRVLVFPPGADAGEVAAAASGAAAISARAGTGDVWIVPQDGGEPRSLNELLALQNIVLELPAGGAP